MQPTFVGSLGSESARGIDSIPSASVGGVLAINSLYGFQGIRIVWSSERADEHGQSDGKAKVD